MEEGTPIPADFPAREALLAAGLTTLEQVDDVDDLTTVKGIGPALALQASDALDSFLAGDDEQAAPDQLDDAPTVDVPDDPCQLPADFPNREQLAAAGINTIEQVAAAASQAAAPTDTVAAPTVPNDPCELPADFPFRFELAAGGINTKEQVKQLGDPTELEGIGPGDVTTIREAADWK